jgi:hypothetical protein
VDEAYAELWNRLDMRIPFMNGRPVSRDRGTAKTDFSFAVLSENKKRTWLFGTKRVHSSGERSLIEIGRPSTSSYRHV